MEQLECLGQLFMVGFAGVEIDQSTRDLVRELGINNFIIFKRNVVNPAQLKKLCKGLKDLCKEYGLPNPLISIDQEGGTVARLGKPFAQFADARKMAESEEPLAALSAYCSDCADDLLDVGINMNLAPVLDVCPIGTGFFMEKRSLGRDPEVVGRYGCHVIRGLQRKGIAACAKHFPGLGAAKIDPHLQLPVVERSRQELEAEDLVPFQRAISEGVASIMTSHTIYVNLDNTNLATMSRYILTDILRGQLGYDGLIITDDLEMGAVENERTVAQAAVLAFSAGVDMLLICHDHGKIRQAYHAVRAAFEKNQDLFEQLNNGLRRMEAVRQKYA